MAIEDARCPIHYPASYRDAFFCKCFPALIYYVRYSFFSPSLSYSTSGPAFLMASIIRPYISTPKPASELYNLFHKPLHKQPWNVPLSVVDAGKMFIITRYAEDVIVLFSFCL